MRRRIGPALRRQRGAGIVETMIGILIGLLVVLVVLSLVSTSEKYKRTSTSASDAQVTGLLSQFMLARDAGNGGNGISFSASELMKCNDWTLRAIPVIVTDSGNNDVSDSFIATSSGASHVLWPSEFTATAGPGADFQVQTPNGFTVPTPATTPYLVIASDGAGNCELTQVTAATAADPVTGVVTLTHGPTVNTYAGPPIPAHLVNLGPLGQASRVRYDVAGDQLRTTDLFAGGAPNPVAQNVVLMKIQYGVDTSPTPDGTLDCWTPANSANTCGMASPSDFTEVQVRTFSQADVERIVAVRIGVVVRSDEPDLKDDTLKFANRPAVTLFNCSADDATCQSRIVLTNAVIQDYWRYRTYETVVPLRNVIYNTTIP